MTPALSAALNSPSKHNWCFVSRGSQSTPSPLYPLDHSPQRNPDTEPQVSAAHLHPERILFLDDDPLLSTLGHRFLSKLGYEVETEIHPVKAIERFRAGKFDLVFTDLTMPLVSGLEIARECRATHPNIPIILMTGYNPTLQAEELLEYGIIHVILKPYGLQALSEAVNIAFGKAADAVQVA